MRFRRAVVVGSTFVAVAASSVAGAAPSKGPAAAAAPVRLVAAGDDPIAVAGLHGFLGTVKLITAADGLVVVNRLPLERYLLGLNEVPLDWPMEALKAQAVAARTYAAYTLDQPRAGAAATYGFDICASVQCQVFSGADVLQARGADRWISAVRSTAGEILTYGGEPILARYHSTSGGNTLRNSQAFPDEPDHPYLQSVASTAEQGSSLYRWTTSFRLRDLQAILRRAGWWSQRHGRLKRVHTVASSSGLHYPDVVFDGSRGFIVRTAEELRDVVRDLAPEMFPGSYPGAAPTSSGRLPETFPSNRIRISTRGKRAVVIGRGWGHGVGMSQWGAHGLARRGLSYTGILGHYYRGVELARAGPRGPIDVGVAWARSSIRVSGVFRVVDGRGRTLVKRALGDWTFRWGGGEVVHLDPPAGHGLPLRVAIVDAPRRVGAGDPIRIIVALSKPARVRPVTHPSAGRAPGSRRIRRAGKRSVMWVAPAKPGRYRLRIEASTGAVARRSEPVQIVVAGEAPPAGPRADMPAAPPEHGRGLEALALVLLIGASAMAWIIGTIRR